MQRAVTHARSRVCLFMVAIVASIAFVPSAAAQAAADPHVTAQYAVVIDADSGQVLFNKGMDTPAAPASLTKIFTAAIALSTASLDKQLTVDSYDLVGESSMGLQAGQKVSLRSALYGMMLPSGNDAAMTIAQNLGALPGDTPQQSVDRFMERVNSTATRLGLSGTHLVTPHGLDTQGHQTTARDIAAMTMFALRNQDFRQIIGTPYYHAPEGFDLYQANHLNSVYQGLIGGKTGITDNAGYCLMEAAKRNGHTVVTVILKSTSDAWYSDASTLLDYGFDTLASGSVPANLPKISLAPAPPAVVSTVNVSNNAPANLTISQVSEGVAVVHHSQLPGIGPLSWRWPAAAALTMLLAMGLVLGHRMLFAVAGLIWHQRSTLRMVSARQSRPSHRAVRRHYRQPAVEELVNMPPAAGAMSSTQSFRPLLLDTEKAAVATVASEGPDPVIIRAIRYVEAGNYRGAAEEFKRVIDANPTLDLTRCRGFWSMKPAGYLAAARAYAQRDRLPDARSLLTVVRLGCNSDGELQSLLYKVVTPA